MREILFRGKRMDNGEWIKGYYAPIGEYHYILTGRLELVPYLGFEHFLVNPDTVGQFTGLTDRNGVKIFEGDIVSGIAYSSENIGEIVWIDKIAAFGVRYRCREDPTAWENSSILKAVSYGKKNEYAAKIIGNIHDNPELLEVSRNEM